jgi:anti-sigma regulatory factor (Ser/Thr protein kinase)
MDSRVRALYKIDPRPEGPAVARRIIAEELGERVPDRVLDDVKLMVSELVTNGIVHGAAPVTLDLCLNGVVLCRVLDEGRGGFAKGARREGPGGWGLQVVEQLSDRWGMQCTPQRTEVWFERQAA